VGGEEGRSMTEQEWLTTSSTFALMTAKRVMVAPRRMQLFGEGVNIQDTVRTPLIVFTPRKIRLYGAACCRRASPRLSPVFLDLLLDVERLVDTLSSTGEPDDLRAKASEELERLRVAERNNYHPGVFSAAEAVVFTADPGVDPVEFGVNLSNNLACSAGEVARKDDEEDRWPPEVEAASEAESTAHCSLFRDIFNNPFRPVSIDPAWFTPTVISLAQAAYDIRDLPGGTLDNARLAVLADVLEGTACDNADILNHLRSPGPHVRGCFALDLLLEKE
jgi:hypothetical protein